MAVTTAPERSSRFVLAALGLGLVVLVPVLVLIVVHGFNGLYGQDAFGYTGYSLGPLTEALRRLEPPPPFFWTPGYPLLVAITALATGVGDSAGQVVSLVSGTAAPIFAALLASELAPARESPRARTLTALLAGVTLALTGQLMQSSAVAMSDTAALAASTIAAWAVCRYARTGGGVLLCLGAGFATFAVDVRLVYGLIALVLAFVGLVGMVRIYRADRRRAIVHFVAATLVATVVAAPIVAPLVTAAAAGQPLPFIGQFDVHVWRADNILSSSIDTIDGHFDYALPMAGFYLLQPFQHYWFLAMGSFAVPGVLAVIRRREVISAAVLLAWPLLQLGYLVGDAYQNTRYLHVAAVPIAILIAFGVLATYRFVERRFGHRRPRAGQVVVVLVVIALAVNAALAVRFTNTFIERVATDAANVRSLAAQIPDDARILTLGATPILNHDGHPDVSDLVYLDAESVLELIGDGRPAYVLIDPASISGQWRGMGPQLAVDALESSPGLDEIGAAGIWKLYSVGPI